MARGDLATLHESVDTICAARRGDLSLIKLPVDSRKKLCCSAAGEAALAWDLARRARLGDWVELVGTSEGACLLLGRYQFPSFFVPFPPSPPAGAKARPDDFGLFFRDWACSSWRYVGDTATCHRGS